MDRDCSACGLHLGWLVAAVTEEIWGQPGKKFWLDNCAYLAVSSIRDPIVAREISDMCGTFAVIAYSEGDNRGTQGGMFGRRSWGWNVNRHEIKRPVIALSEVIADLKRDELLGLGLRHPAIIKRGLWWRIPELAEAIEQSPYQEEAA
jgi:type IV secretory pathway TraG/TraD family ATPase VirD4